jgi:predicted nucleic acid-binding protein
VILVDVNILVYASNDDTEQHAAALQWLDGQLTGSVPVGLRGLRSSGSCGSQRIRE